MLHEANSLGTITHKYNPVTLSIPRENKRKIQRRGERKDGSKQHITEDQGTSSLNPVLQMGKMRPREVQCLAKTHNLWQYQNSMLSFNMNKKRTRWTRNS